MKILKSFPSVSVVAAPQVITQDIGQMSKIILESDLFCKEFLPVKIKLSGSAVMGVDFFLFYEDNTQIPYRNLNNNNEHLIELYLFNSSNILNFYLFPINFGSYIKKEVEIHVVSEPRVYFSKIPSAYVTLSASNSVCVQDFVTNPPQTSTGLNQLYPSSVDVAESQLQIQSSYAVIDNLMHPTVQFESASYSFGDTVVVTRSGDLSQNSVVKLYKSTTPLIDAPPLYLIFAVGQNSINIPVSTTQMTSEFSMTLSTFNNANIGPTSTTLVT